MANKAPRKILIVRFSSIGDIVLTFPVVTAIKSMYPDCSVDYATKQSFQTLLEACPQIDSVFTLKNSLHALRQELNLSQYDAILDLHNNLRTRILLRFYLTNVFRFPKKHLQKWLLTTFQIFPKKSQHVVERYLSTLSAVLPDWQTEQFSYKYEIPQQALFDIQARFELAPKSYLAIAIGAQFGTKRLPTDLLIALIKKIKDPVLLLGAKEDQIVAQTIQENCVNQVVCSAVGQTSIHESAWLVKNANGLLTHDTGLMHIGAAFSLPLYVVWGNTIKDFGMYPYRLNQAEVFHFEVADLSCRPCSKIGFQSCPKGHFSCMRKQDLAQIAQAING